MRKILRFERSTLCALLGTTLLTPFVVSTSAFAQNTQKPAPDDVVVEEVVVTGTLLRGVAPAGSNTLSVGQEQITASGASSSAQLLASVPQVADTFNTRPAVSGAQASQTINRVSLRTLPGGGGGGGSSTLFLVDGHRVPGMGVKQTIGDPDAIAPGAIARVEIVTDGGSSTYGADAVGGVINFITRRQYNGVEASARYGTADGFKSVDTNLTVGKTVGDTSAYLSYNYAWHGKLYGRDRDFAKTYDYVLNAPAALTCAPGNVAIGATVYALPGLTAGLGNRCDITENQTILPSEERHSVFAGFSTNFGSAKFDLRGFYTHRQNVGSSGFPTGQVSISPTTSTGGVNPFYRSVGGANAAAAQTVMFNLANVRGAETLNTSTLNAWQIAPTLTFDIGSNWQVRTLASYGQGYNVNIARGFDTGTLSSLVQRGLFNPYDPTAAVNAPYMGSLRDFGEYGRGVNKLANLRTIADGRLFALPGGDVRAAVGAEWLREEYKVLSGTSALSAVTAPRGSAARHTEAVFGEIQVPVVGEGNRLQGVHDLSLSLSGRYDHYSDFGGTFNPKIGATYGVTDWLRFRGTWGKSFQAPSLADTAAAAGSSIIALPFVVYQKAGFPALPGQAQIFLSGGGANLKPQKAKTWNVGFEVEPPMIDNLSIRANYYKIDFRDLISIPPVFNPSVYYALFSGYTINPTAAQVAAFGAQAPGGSSVVAPYVLRDGQVYSIIDGRRQNLATAATDGIDFSVSYTRPTRFGSVYGSLAGNKILTIQQQAKTGAAVVDVTDNGPHVRATATIGTTVGDLRAQLAVSHQSSFRVNPTAANLQQSKLDAYDITKLYVEYRVSRPGVFQDTVLSLNVENLFDVDPPAYNGSLNGGNGYAGGNPLGRFVQVGIKREF